MIGTKCNDKNSRIAYHNKERWIWCNQIFASICINVCVSVCEHIYTHIPKAWKEAEQILRKRVVSYDKYECGIKYPLFTLHSFIIFIFPSSMGNLWNLKNVTRRAHTIINIPRRCLLCKGYVRNSLLRRF